MGTINNLIKMESRAIYKKIIPSRDFTVLRAQYSMKKCKSLKLFPFPNFKIQLKKLNSIINHKYAVNVKKANA